jgi:transposase
VFGAVCPSEGKAAALIMPICNTAAMNHHLSEISSQVAIDAHALVILDGAGWRRSQALVVPGNITLLELPPYSPELNPVEWIWHYLRSHWLANSVFPSLADIMDAREMAWNRFATDHGLIRSLCAVAGRASGRHHPHQGELHIGRRYPIVLRWRRLTLSHRFVTAAVDPKRTRRS